MTPANHATATRDASESATNEAAIYERMIAGDALARNEFIEANMHSVQVLVDQFCFARNAERLRDDLQSVGYLAITVIAKSLCCRNERLAGNVDDYVFRGVRNAMNTFLIDENFIGPSASYAKSYMARGGDLSNVIPASESLGSLEVSASSQQLTVDLQDSLDSCCHDDRDRNVLALLGTGMTQLEVAHEIGVSERTVRSVKCRIEREFTLAV